MWEVSLLNRVGYEYSLVFSCNFMGNRPQHHLGSETSVFGLKPSKYVVPTPWEKVSKWSLRGVAKDLMPAFGLDNLLC